MVNEFYSEFLLSDCDQNYDYSYAFDLVSSVTELDDDFDLECDLFRSSKHLHHYYSHVIALTRNMTSTLTLTMVTIVTLTLTIMMTFDVFDYDDN